MPYAYKGNGGEIKRQAAQVFRTRAISPPAGWNRLASRSIGCILSGMFAGICCRSFHGKVKSLPAIAMLVIASMPGGLASEPLDVLVDNAVRTSLVRLERSVSEVGDPALYPTYGTPQLKWQLKSSADWTSGFYPGCLWYACEISRDRRFEGWARQWTTAIEQEKLNPDTHDLGFRFMGSFGNGLRRGHGPDYDRYPDILRTAAATLARRFNPRVGALSSNWDLHPAGRSVPVVIDIMMNLDLLFWAAKNGGPPELAQMARAHAMTTARDFVRPDGGTYHVIRYDPDTGAIINRGTLQGAGPKTTWSRGHAWGLYGMVAVYRHTREQRFLDTAMKLADYFISHLPADHVAAWDFQSDIKYRDVSATAIVAAALFEMVRYIDDAALRSHYETEAEAMLASLCQPPWFATRADTNCLLDHSVQFLPINSNVDVPAIFADYYFLEAIIRYRAGQTAGRPGNK
jgi:unsaturated chondroitin disaccharide hydrolase